MGSLSLRARTSTTRAVAAEEPAAEDARGAMVAAPTQTFAEVYGTVSFSSVPCQASTVPFPMTPPYVGGASSSFFLSPFSLTLVATHLARPHRA